MGWLRIAFGGLVVALYAYGLLIGLWIVGLALGG
jgi:hypothetical protein